MSREDQHVERDIVGRIEARAATARNPLGAIVEGCLAFVAIAVDDELRQVALIDGPQVLGWSRWRAIDAEFGLGSLNEGLRACHDAGWLKDVDATVLAHLISGAVNEAVFVIAESNDRPATHRAVTRVLTTTLRRLVVAGSRSDRLGTRAVPDPERNLLSKVSLSTRVRQRATARRR